jgi:hypothetical protein
VNAGSSLISSKAAIDDGNAPAAMSAKDDEEGDEGMAEQTQTLADMTL